MTGKKVAKQTKKNTAVVKAAKRNTTPPTKPPAAKCQKDTVVKSKSKAKESMNVIMSGTELRLTVRSPSGSKFPLVLLTSDTLNTIKSKICDLIGMPEDQQAYIYKGKQLLGDTKTLSELNIGKNTTVQLVLVMRGVTLLPLR